MSPQSTVPMKIKLLGGVSIALLKVGMVLALSYFFGPGRDAPVDTQTKDVSKRTLSASLIEIPFTLTENNNISIEVVLNGHHRLALMFHTGNSDVCLTQEATKNLKDLVFDHQVDANSWGGTSSVKFCDGNSLTIGGHVWDNLTVVEDKLSGKGTDGKFGPDLFEGKFVEIDFERRVLRVQDSLPDSASTYQKFECRLDRSSIFIEGQLEMEGKSVSNEFMVHSGFSGTILFDDGFVNANDLNQLKTISESELRDSFGNVLKTKKVLLPKLTFGNASFSDIPVGFFDGSIGRQKMSVVGGDVLKRFNVILGSDRTEVYLKPNHLFDLEFAR